MQTIHSISFFPSSDRYVCGTCLEDCSPHGGWKCEERASTFHSWAKICNLRYNKKTAGRTCLGSWYYDKIASSRATYEHRLSAWTGRELELYRQGKNLRIRRYYFFFLDVVKHRIPEIRLRMRGKVARHVATQQKKQSWVCSTIHRSAISIVSRPRVVLLDIGRRGSFQRVHGRLKSDATQSYNP